MDKEILFSTEKFDVIQKGNRVGVEPLYISVATLPFTRDEGGLPLELGVLWEYNEIRSTEGVTVVTGSAEGEDPDVLTAAKRALFDRSGLDVQEDERWFFLGFLTTHKMVKQELPCFAVDISGMEMPTDDEEEDDEEEDDDTKLVQDEPTREPKFVLMGVNQALDTSDCFVPAIFMKVFKYIFGFGGQEGEEAGKDDPTHQEIMDIEGVLGAGKNGNEWKVHIKADADEASVESKVQAIVGEDAEVVVERTPEQRSEEEQEEDDAEEQGN